MTRLRPLVLPASLLAATLGLGTVVLLACGHTEPAEKVLRVEPPTFRLALFNVRELSAEKLSAVDADGVGTDPQLRAAAQVVQRVRPDVLVVQEIDYPYPPQDPVRPGPETESPDPTRFARWFAQRYLAAGEDGIDYPHAFAAPVNTGLLSGFDLNGDGVVATEAEVGSRAYGDDCLGWGTYPGQYGMAVLSRLPFADADRRTFRRFPWRLLPGNHLPPGFYSDAELAVLPLSSKSHWDLPVAVGEGAARRHVHLWVSHPTPPIFDGDEDRNGRRNFDEVRFWKLYLAAPPELVDDAGRAGGYAAGEPFVVVGDLNADPASPEGVYDGRQSVTQLLALDRFQDAGRWLVSRGAAATERVAGAPSQYATAAFRPSMRLDHLIPSRDLEVVDGGVFWPSVEEDPEGAELADRASDHRLVWLDLRVP
jgi:hypothetical protein